MNKAIISRIRSNHISQEIIINTIAIPALAYFVYVCFPMLQKAGTLFVSLIIVSGTAALVFGYGMKLYCTRHIRKVLSADDINTVPGTLLADAKQQAYMAPLVTSITIFWRWVLAGIFGVIAPVIVFQDAPLKDFLYCAPFVIFAGIGTMPYAYLSTESGIAEFLRIPAVNNMDLDAHNRKKKNFFLTPKILLFILTILLPPLGFLINGIFICIAYNMPLETIKLGFFLAILQSLFYSVLTSIMFARNIKTAVDDVVNILMDLSHREGDLTKSIISTSNDEIGDLAFWFNKFMDNLRNIIKHIIRNAESLDASSNELSQFSQYMSRNADNMSDKTNIVTASAEEMSSNITSVAAFMEQAAANVNIVASATEEMTTSITEIAQNSEKARTVTGSAVSYARNASSQVDKLGEAARDISKITQAISEISEQTNLLALNATIEAARAGDAGRSFAVVAAEIKELATQTAESTKEIRQRISGIQESTAGTINEIKNISDIILDVNAIVDSIASAVEEQAVTTREIAGNIAEASKGNQEVSVRVSESSEVSGNIARDISSVYQSADEISKDSAKVNLNAENLSQLADTLKSMVDKFKI